MKTSPALVESRERPPFPAAYFDTVFLVPLPPAEWPETFAIVTAHNPLGQMSPEHANNESDRELAAHLASEGLESFAVVGAARDLSHHEAGRAFATKDLAQAAAISTRFRQLAFYWVDRGFLHLCVDASGRAWPVAPWPDRLA